MAYYGAPPGAYGYPGSGMPQSGPPSNMGPPPGMESAPGMMSSMPPASVPPMQQFQPNMPNIPPNLNFNAPIIRLGVGDNPGKPSTPTERTHGSRMDGRGSNAEPLGNRGRAGLGAGPDGGRNLDRERAAVRESMMALQPPTREEVARTIFIGGLGEGAPSDGVIESVLRCAGKLRRWTRARDADDKLCKFGFAEYEDVDSLEAANEIFESIEVPTFRGNAVVKDEESNVKMTKLLVVVDDQSKAYIEEWKGKRNEDEEARQFRIDGCKEDLRQCLLSLSSAGKDTVNGTNGFPGVDERGDVQMGGTDGQTTGESAEVVNIPLSLEEELTDIPAEARATVAAEIKAFRDRSNRKDLERLKKEEEMEQAERHRSMAGSRINRLASPPLYAPSGPASASNGIPVGPRGAPSGPKGFRGVQIPNDYANGVNFVSSNGGMNGVNPEDEEAEESDGELERRRQEKLDADMEKQFLDAERRLLNRERTRGAAQERERVRDDAETKEREKARESMAKYLREWDDEEEIRAGKKEFYADRSAWVRHRAPFRERELRDDERDREDEDHEKMEEMRLAAEAKGNADNFLDQVGLELEQKGVSADPTSKGAVKISLGGMARRQQDTAVEAPKKRALVYVENMLEDEEEGGLARRPELKPLQESAATAAAHGDDLTDAERSSLQADIVREIPNSAADLFAYPIKWSYLTAPVLDTRVRPYVEKKVVEFLGVQEDLLVETVMDGLAAHKEAGALISELEDALEDEAEKLMVKVWRFVAFTSEGEARGI